MHGLPHEHFVYGWDRQDKQKTSGAICKPYFRATFGTFGLILPQAKPTLSSIRAMRVTFASGLFLNSISGSNGAHSAA